MMFMKIGVIISLANWTPRRRSGALLCGVAWLVGEGLQSARCEFEALEAVVLGHEVGSDRNAEETPLLI